jgi:hypothetical protein
MVINIIYFVSILIFKTKDQAIITTDLNRPKIRQSPFNGCKSDPGKFTS